MGQRTINQTTHQPHPMTPEEINLFIISFNKITKHAHTTNVQNGWWEKRLQSLQILKNHGIDNTPHLAIELLGLITTEISEAIEAIRKHQPTTWPDPNTPDTLVRELAGTIVRIMDLASHLNLPLAQAITQEITHNTQKTLRKAAPESPTTTMKNIAIIYHDADFDGKLSNEVCRFHLARLFPNASIHSYGWDYGRPVPWPYQAEDQEERNFEKADWPDYDAIYIVDLSVDELMSRPELRDKIVWIDHHKSAIEKWDAQCGSDDPRMANLNGSRIDGVAACRLCWQWFTWGKLPKGVLPSKQDFIEPLTKALFVDRKVREPELLRLAGEYDVWDHRDQNAKELQFGLRACNQREFDHLVQEQFNDTQDGDVILSNVIGGGRMIKSYCDKQADEYSSEFSHTIKWEGLTFCALNIGQRGNSDLLRGGIKPEHDACFAWRFTGKDVLVSLYHIEGKTHHDLSLIAVKYGGGGHKGACGFRVPLWRMAEIIDTPKDNAASI